jgi:hypothetical protein
MPERGPQGRGWIAGRDAETDVAIAIEIEIEIQDELELEDDG